MFNALGYSISKADGFKSVTFDDINKIQIEKTNPIIFDVGANEGQSIERFQNLFPESFIHSFEPDISVFKN